MPTPTLSTTMIALFALAFAVLGCDGLGNAPGESLTEWTSFSAPAVELESRARTLPISRSNELLESVEGGKADHFDREARPGSMVSLVTVRATWRAPAASRELRLTTLFRFRDGGELERSWTADTSREVWYAGFALPARPASATTFPSP